MTAHINYRERTIELIGELEGKFIERNELIRLLVLAVLCKEHLFMIGKPGVAKSYLARVVAGIVKKTSYFEYLINENVKYDEIFTQDANSVIQAHFVFLDELYKVESNTAILNAFLQIMNERIFTKGFETHQLPLITMIGASNELPSSGSLGAFDDRLIFRYEVVRIQERQNFLRFLKSDFDKSKTIVNAFSLKDLEIIEKQSEDIIVTDEIYNLLYEIDADMMREQSDISNRKMGKAERILRVSAYLNGRDRVNISDLFLLQHIAWQNYKERDRIKALLPRKLYGSRSAVENEFISITEGLNLLFGKIRALKGFLTYKEQFEGEEETFEKRFHIVRESLAASFVGLESDDGTECIFGLTHYSDRLEMLLNQYHSMRVVENEVKENIFLVGQEANTFAPEMFKNINSLLHKTQQEGKKIRKFVIENQHYREYLNNCFKQANR